MPRGPGHTALRNQAKGQRGRYPAAHSNSAPALNGVPRIAPPPIQIQCPQHPLVAPAFAQTPTIGRPTSTSKSPRFWVAICLSPPSRKGWVAPHDKSRPAPACHPLQIWPSASTPPPPEYISDLNFRACPPWPGGRPAALRGKPRTATARLRQLILTSNSKSAPPKTLNPRFSGLVMAPIAHTGKIPGWRQNPIYLTVTTPRQAG